MKQNNWLQNFNDAFGLDIEMPMPTDVKPKTIEILTGNVLRKLPLRR